MQYREVEEGGRKDGSGWVIRGWFMVEKVEGLMGERYVW